MGLSSSFRQIRLGTLTPFDWCRRGARTRKRLQPPHAAMILIGDLRTVPRGVPRMLNEDGTPDGVRFRKSSG